jgi:hypothetical protein
VTKTSFDNNMEGFIDGEHWPVPYSKGNWEEIGLIWNIVKIAEWVYVGQRDICGNYFILRETQQETSQQKTIQAHVTYFAYIPEQAVNISDNNIVSLGINSKLSPKKTEFTREVTDTVIEEVTEYEITGESHDETPWGEWRENAIRVPEANGIDPDQVENDVWRYMQPWETGVAWDTTITSNTLKNSREVAYDMNTAAHGWMDNQWFENGIGRDDVTYWYVHEPDVNWAVWSANRNIEHRTDDGKLSNYEPGKQFIRIDERSSTTTTRQNPTFTTVESSTTTFDTSNSWTNDILSNNTWDSLIGGDVSLKKAVRKARSGILEKISTLFKEPKSKIVNNTGDRILWPNELAELENRLALESYDPVLKALRDAEDQANGNWDFDTDLYSFENFDIISADIDGLWPNTRDKKIYKKKTKH